MHTHRDKTDTLPVQLGALEPHITDLVNYIYSTCAAAKLDDIINVWKHQQMKRNKCATKFRNCKTFLSVCVCVCEGETINARQNFLVEPNSHWARLVTETDRWEREREREHKTERWQEQEREMVIERDRAKEAQHTWVWGIANKYFNCSCRLF